MCVYIIYKSNNLYVLNYLSQVLRGTKIDASSMSENIKLWSVNCSYCSVFTKWKSRKTKASKKELKFFENVLSYLHVFLTRWIRTGQTLNSSRPGGSSHTYKGNSFPAFSSKRIHFYFNKTWLLTCSMFTAPRSFNYLPARINKIYL